VSGLQHFGDCVRSYLSLLTTTNFQLLLNQPALRESLEMRPPEK